MKAPRLTRACAFAWQFNAEPFILGTKACLLGQAACQDLLDGDQTVGLLNAKTQTLGPLGGFQAGLNSMVLQERDHGQVLGAMDPGLDFCPPFACGERFKHREQVFLGHATDLTLAPELAHDLV